MPRLPFPPAACGPRRHSRRDCDRPPFRCAVVSSCGFRLRTQARIGHPYLLKSFAPWKHQAVYFLVIDFREFFIYSGNMSLIRYMIYRPFLLLCGFAFLDPAPPQPFSSPLPRFPMVLVPAPAAAWTYDPSPPLAGRVLQQIADAQS